MDVTETRASDAEMPFVNRRDPARAWEFAIAGLAAVVWYGRPAIGARLATSMRVTLACAVPAATRPIAATMPPQCFMSTSPQELWRSVGPHPGIHKTK